MTHLKGPHMLDVVIVSWNSEDTLAQCVNSVLDVSESDGIPVSVVVVDNGSERPPVGCPFNALIITNTCNEGFAAACNRGAAAGSSPWILFLNPDVILKEGSLRVAMNALSGGEEKIVGIQLRDRDGRVQRTCAKRPTTMNLCARSLGIDRTRVGRRFGPLMTEFDYTADAHVDQVIGAFFCTTRRLFGILGGFDTRFFVYYEEVDFCVRAAKLGAPTEHLGSKYSVHLGGTSTVKAGPLRYAYASVSRYIYARKHLSKAGAAVVGICSLVLEPCRRTLHELARGRMAGAWMIVQSYLQWVRSQRAEPG